MHKPHPIRFVTLVVYDLIRRMHAYSMHDGVGKVAEVDPEAY